MLFIKKIARGNCLGCDRENCCYFGVAIKCFPIRKKWFSTREGSPRVRRLIEIRLKGTDLEP